MVFPRWSALSRVVSQPTDGLTICFANGAMTARNLLESIHLLANAAANFAQACVAGITANRVTQGVVGS